MQNTKVINTISLLLFFFFGYILIVESFVSTSTRLQCRYDCYHTRPRMGFTTKSLTSIHMTSSPIPAQTEDILLSSIDTNNNITNSNNTSTDTKIQRKYKTYRWKYNMENYDINFRVEGPINGQPIVLIHGFGANLNHFRHQFMPLANAGYRVYAIDLLGFGASPKPGNVEYSIELFVQLVSDFIQTMDPSSAINEDKKKNWIVAGNSIGGLVCLGVAEELKNLVRGVVLFNCAGGMTGFRYSDVPMYVRPLLWFFQKVLLGPKMGSTFFKRFKTRANVESILRGQGVYRDQSKVDEELLEILLEPSEDEGAERVFLKTFAGPPGPMPEEILPTLECPVLALWGDSDPWTPVDRGMHPGSKFGSYCDDFKLQIIPNCGHCPHDEQPDLVNDVMLSWIDELNTRTMKENQKSNEEEGVVNN